MGAAVTNKSQMYDLLRAGAFGSTIPQYMSVDEWERSGEAGKYALWGVRSLIPGGPCRLYCPAAEVRSTAAAFGCPVNVSLMIDAVVEVTLYADIYDAPGGLLVYGVEHPGKGASWRQLMPSRGREWRGLAARGLLARHLCPSSLADVEAVFERWPGHVLELSATTRPVGTVAGRNHVVWECRLY